SRHLYQRKMATGALYRAELASQLQDRVYQIERDGDSFRITDVPKTAEAVSSQRRTQLVTALAKRGASSAKASEIAALDTRIKKELKDPAQLRQNWQARAAAHGLTPEAAGKLQKSERQATAAMPEAPTILRGLTENASTFTNRDIWR